MKSMPGRLLKCDPALKEYLLWLDNQSNTNHFIIADLDAQHLFIVNSPNIEAWLQTKIDDWHDANSYTEAASEDVESGGVLPTGHVAAFKK